MFNKDKGFKKIRGVIGQFKTMVAKLDEGTKLLQGEKTTNNTKIDTLKQRNNAIVAEITAAANVKAQLQTIITGGAAIADCEVEKTAS